MAAKSFRLGAESEEKLTHLATLLAGGNETEALRRAIDALYAQHYPSTEAGIQAYTEVVLTDGATCVECGEAIPARARAWQELWTDKRTGGFVCLRCESQWDG